MLDWSIKLFRVCGIRLELHFTFFLLPFAIGIHGYQEAGPAGFLWGIFLISFAFTSVVMHELGHSLAARKFDISADRILLLPIGGIAQFQSLPRTPSQEIIITLAGPFVNFVIAGLFYPVFGIRLSQSLPLDFKDLMATMVFFNLLMGSFNMIPVFPMDGGRILRSVLSFWIRPLKATAIASRSGTFIASASGIYIALSTTNYLLAALFLFIAWASRMEYQSFSRSQAFSGLRLRDFVDADYLSIPTKGKLSDAVKALANSPPQDVLLIENQAVMGLLKYSKLAKACEKYALDSPAEKFAKFPVATLNIDSPVESAFAISGADDQDVIPVYDYATLLGVVRKDQMIERANWINKRNSISTFCPEL
ncbi:MAG: site-2 protease family protein [Verrucomicrobiota bacterium]